MDTVIGVGLIGLGTIGRSHARALDALRDRAELHAFSGGDAAAAAEAGWPEATQAPPEELITRDDVDVVAICSPSGVHAEQALAALGAGKHVVVEKPLALTAADADRIVGLAAERGRSEEHTSELQSRGHLVCRLLLEKKKKRDRNK